MSDLKLERKRNTQGMLVCQQYLVKDNGDNWHIVFVNNDHTVKSETLNVTGWTCGQLAEAYKHIYRLPII